MGKQKNKIRRAQEYRQFMQKPAEYKSKAERHLMEMKRHPLPPKAEAIKAVNRRRSKGKPGEDPYLMALEMYERTKTQ